MIKQHPIFLSDMLYQSMFSKWISSLIEILKEYGVQYQFLSGTRDVWVRDFMPISLGNNQYVQFSLTNDYYFKRDYHKRTDPAPICKTLCIEPSIPKYKGNPIYLDGGNVIRGFGKVIITEKILHDNNIPGDALEKLLKKVLKVEQVIFIPIEPLDDTGHSDSMVRFVDDHTVVANDYSESYTPESFKDIFYGVLAGAGFDVLPVPYYPSEERRKEYNVATGCYINFLQVGDKIFLPTFDDPVNDGVAIKRFGEIFGEENVIPVPSHEIALGGGVLNCLTWEIQP